MGKMLSLRDFLTQKMGMDFRPRDRQKSLKRAVSELTHVKEISPGELPHYFLARPEEFQAFLQKLLIGESYFFRHIKQFALVKNWLEERLTNSPLHFLSAGCSTGEEAYSLAVMARELSLLKTTKISAVDINKKFLRKARQGIYTQNSFRRETPDYFRQRYFEKLDDKRWKIKSEFRQSVIFSHLNLCRPLFPPFLENIDLIFCRNVLIYLEEEATQRLLEKFYSALRPGGILVVSPCESLLLENSPFERYSHKMATAFLKPSVLGKTLKKKELPPIEKEPLPQKIAPPPRKKGERQKEQSPSNGAPKGSPKGSQKKIVLGEVLDKCKDFFNQHRYLEVIEEILSLDSEVREKELDYYLALSYESLHLYDRALETHQKIIDQNPHFVLSRVARGEIFLKMGKTSPFIIEFDKAKNILERGDCEETLPLSEGITAGALLQVVKSTLQEVTEVK